MNGKIHLYAYQPGDFRREVRAEADCWIIFICTDGSGFAMKHLEAGEVWQEGAEELHGIYDTRADADKAWAEL